MDIPFKSNSYNDDLKIINFCKKNTNDSRCECVFPTNIEQHETNSFNPYYCWYAPCKNDNVFKTSLIIEYQKTCNVVICNVDIKDIYMDTNGSILINNTCNAMISVNSKTISDELLNKSLNKNYILPNIFLETFFPISLGLLSIILI